MSRCCDAPIAMNIKQEFMLAGIIFKRDEV